MGTLRSHGSKDDKNIIRLLSNTATLHVLYTFCYITVSSLHDKEVNVFFK